MVKQAWEEDNPIRVLSLAGPAVGQQFDVEEALPYTLETANACREDGYYVMDADGEVIPPKASSNVSSLPLRLPSIQNLT
jgi:hypothetical protein